MSKATGAVTHAVPVLFEELTMLTERLITDLKIIALKNKLLPSNQLKALMEDIDQLSRHDLDDIFRLEPLALKGLNIILSQSYSEPHFRFISSEYLGTLMRMLPYSGCAHPA